MSYFTTKKLFLFTSFDIPKNVYKDDELDKNTSVHFLHISPNDSNDEIVKHPHSSQPGIAIKCGVGKTTLQNVNDMLPPLKQ